MTLSLADKKVVVQSVAEVASKAISIVAAEYRGMTVNAMTELRQKARDAGVDLRVVRNTLARIALKETSFACAIDELKGPLFIAFSLESPGAAAKVIKEFAKGNEALKVKFLSISGELLTAADIDAVASLPTYEEAIGKLMWLIKAPIEKLAKVLAAPQLKLVRTLAAVRDEKQ